MCRCPNTFVHTAYANITLVWSISVVQGICSNTCVCVSIPAAIRPHYSHFLVSIMSWVLYWMNKIGMFKTSVCTLTPTMMNWTRSEGVLVFFQNIKTQTSARKHLYCCFEHKHHRASIVELKWTNSLILYADTTPMNKCETLTKLSISANNGTYICNNVIVRTLWKKFSLFAKRSPNGHLKEDKKKVAISHTTGQAYIRLSSFIL